MRPVRCGPAQDFVAEVIGDPNGQVVRAIQVVAVLCHGEGPLAEVRVCAEVVL